MRLSRKVVALAMGVLSAFVGVAGTSVTMETPAFALSIKHNGVRASAGAETLTYSSLWDGGEDSTATIAQDGMVLWTGLSDEGDKAWTVSRNGTYVLTHTTFTDGAAGKVETATFVVSGKDEPFADGDVAAVGHSAAYDGAAHGISVTAPDGASVRYSLNKNGPFEAEAPSFKNVCGATKVWFEVTKAGFIPYTNSATVAILPRPVTLQSGTKTDFVYDGTAHEFPVLAKSENGFVAGEGIVTSNWATVTTVAQGEVANTFAYAPIEGTDLANYEITVVTGKIAVVAAAIPSGPTGAIAAVGYTNAYDGAAHGVSVAATGLLTAPKVQYKATATAEWQDASPTYTDVCDTQVWWRVSAPNYADATGTIGLKITPRPVTVSVVGKTATFAYDGTEKTVEGYEISTEDTLYDIATNTKFRGEALAADEPTISRTDIGVTAMNLKPADFTNADANFDVTYAVEDGSLTVTLGEIVYVAQGCEVEYDGEGHSVAVRVSAPAGLVPKYALAKDGPYSADAPAFTNVCSDIVVWFALEADQYAAVTNSAAVTISKRSLAEATLAAIPDQVYTGAEIKPPLSFADSGSRKVTDKDYTAVYSDNVRVGTATVRIAATEGGNYSGEVVASFNIVKATHGDVEEPGEGDVPEGGLSKFDADAVVYDGKGHTVDTDALVVAFNAAMAGAGETRFEYASDDGSGEGGHAGRVTLPTATGDGNVAWSELAPAFTNAGEYVVWYRVTNPNYEDFVHAAKVTITKRPVTVSVVGKTATFAYDTTEKTVSGFAATTEDDLYDVEEDTRFVGEDTAATASRTDVGATAMGLTAEDFANDNANFDVTYAVTDGGVTVTPRVIGDDPANWDIRLAKNPMYDGTEKPAPITQVAFVKPNGNLDYIPYDLSGNTATDAGNYVVRIAGKGNYSGTIEKDWAITPRNITLTSSSATWAYDGAAHSEKSVSVTGDGFADGEGATYSGFPVVRHVADAKDPVANAFTCSLNANTKARNYEVTTRYGNVQITPRAVTLTAPTKEKPYDGTPLTFGAGEIEISETGHAGRVTLPNDEAFTFGNFASLTEAGRVDATFSVMDGTALMSDYALTVVHGTLTVTKSAAQITVTAKNGRWVYDGQPHALHEYEATNLGVLQSGDELDVTFDEASVVTTPTDGEARDGVVANTISSVRVVRNGTDDVTANYAVEWFPGTLTVTKRPVTVTVVGKTASCTYDGAEKSVEGYDLSTDDELYDIEADTAFSGAAEATRTDAGKTEMGLVAADFANGNDCFEVTYAVTDGWVKVDPRDIASADDFVLALGANPKYNGTVQSVAVKSVTCGGLPLTYELAGENATHAGTYTLTVKANGNFCGERSTTWQILKREVTLTSGSASKAYDGAPLLCDDVSVVGDGFIGLEGATYEVTGSQTAAGSSKNTFAYTLKEGTLASDYEITTVEGDLVVTKATHDDGGREPGGGEVSPDGGLSKFDAESVVYDGEGHTIDTNALVAAFNAAMAGAGETAFAFARDDGTGASGGAGRAALPWADTAPAFTNAGEYVVWYRVTNPNYEDFAHAAKVTIMKRPVTLTSGTKLDFVYDGTAHEFPVLAKSENGFVAGEGIVTSNWATVTTVAQGEVANTFDYAAAEGTDLANYEISVVTGKIAVVAAPEPEPEPEYAALAGTLAWKLNLATGCYTAQLKLTCTNGFENGISDLLFVYQDRMDGATVASCLWNSSARTKRPTVTLGGVEYRAVALDASRLAAQGVAAVYGVRDVSQPLGTVASDECEIELYVRSLAKPLSDIGYVTWKSNGAQCSLPISAAGGSQGMTVSETMLGAVRLAATASRFAAPLSTAVLDRSLAVGVVLDEASSPYCRLAEFSVADGVVSGRVEVGKVTSGVETRGALGANARVVLLGAASLGGDFAELGGAAVDADGAFRFDLGGAEARFFKVRIDVENVVE